MRACSAPRDDGAGTWITDEMMQAYVALHARGLAHSVETWVDGDLVGGLYGVALGRMFFGESMFAREPDASKIALATLVRVLRADGGADDRLPAEHAAPGFSGGREINRARLRRTCAPGRAPAAIAWAKYRRRLN